MSTATLGSATGLSEVLDEDKDSGDEFKHYVKIRYLAAGGEVEALCGKKWTPGKSTDGLAPCPSCEELMEVLKAMDGV